jgi:hypothetical protein
MSKEIWNKVWLVDKDRTGVWSNMFDADECKAKDLYYSESSSLYNEDSLYFW